MGRMHSIGFSSTSSSTLVHSSNSSRYLFIFEGISASALPYKRTPLAWCKAFPSDVEDLICKLAKRGPTPSKIGVLLRDSHGVPQVKVITGSKILRILKAHGLGPEIPEALYHLIKKAVAIRKHLERNRKDKIRSSG